MLCFASNNYVLFETDVIEHTVMLVDNQYSATVWPHLFATNAALRTIVTFVKSTSAMIATYRIFATFARTCIVPVAAMRFTATSVKSTTAVTVDNNAPTQPREIRSVQSTPPYKRAPPHPRRPV